MTTTTHPSTRFWPALLFGGLVVLVVLVERVITALPVFSQRPALPAAVTFDLLVGIPTLYYFLVVRRYRLPATSVAAVVGACLALAFWLIPVAQQQPLRALRFLPAVLEGIALLVMATKIRTVVRAFRAAYSAEALVWAGVRAGVLSLGRPGAILLAEVDMLRYAALGWWAVPQTQPAARSFSNYRESGFIAFTVMVAVALTVETAAVHLLASHWSATLAGWLLFFDLYSLIMLVAHAQAVRLRPTLLTADSLEVRIGTMWHLVVPRTAIVAIEPLRDAPPADPETLNATRLLFTTPNLLLTFAQPVTISGLFGRRRTARRVAIYLDQPQQFAAEVSSNTSFYSH